MKARVILGTAIAFGLMLVVGCAPYKQLKPDPELASGEAGYVELKDGKKPFKVKQKEKYFISFPAPVEDKFYLVLKVTNKPKFNSFFAETYDGKTIGKRVTDETTDAATTSVCPAGKGLVGPYWFIDNVKEKEVELKMEYRYVPQWRYKFELRHAANKAVYEKNLVDRSVYKNIGSGFRAENISFPVVMDTTAKHTAELKKALQDLVAAESLFPQPFVNSNDKAWVDYKALRLQLEEEIQFQSDYWYVLDFLSKEFKTRNNPSAFLDYVEDYIATFTQRAHFPPNVLQETQSLLGKRLTEIVPYFDQKLSAKDDAAPLDSQAFQLEQVSRVGVLYDAAGVAPAEDVASLAKFLLDFDKRARELQATKAAWAQLLKTVKDQPPMPPNEFFPDVEAKAAAIQKMLPMPMGGEYGKYVANKCAVRLAEEIARGSSEMTTRIKGFHEAGMLVPQMNGLFSQGAYRDMLGILKQYPHLDFLIDKYRRVDTLSVRAQDSKIRDALANRRWVEGENGLKELFADNTFLNPAAVALIKERSVGDLEDSLYETVERVSRARVLKFLDDNVDTLQDIDSLYKDSVFLPCHNITFTTGRKAQLVQRKNQLIEDLGKMKENEFPARAVNLLFDQFTKNPDDNGVLKARAIVCHGKYYKGTGDKDDKVKRKIAEVDPMSAKWIVEPKQYRRLYVVPITDKKRGENKYVFRLNVRVPSDAQFPVFDVNIKLPKEVAQDAASKQWYESIMLNKKPVKPEGRMSITAPSPANDYECQITPVSMNKDESNFLEVTFLNDSWKVLQVSVMVQKPIIKKN